VSSVSPDRCREQGRLLKNSLIRNLKKLDRVRKLYKRFFLSLLDIFYRPIFGFFLIRRVFQQPQDLSPPISECDDSQSVGQKRDV
jgi:hypothetical protein